jgi:hypothetical protein
MNSRIGSLALTTIVALTIAGCAGSDSPTKHQAVAPSAKVKPASGDTVTGTGYTFSAPRGWHKPTQKVPGFDPDSLLLDSNDKDGFADNINVLRMGRASVSGPDALEKVSKSELESIHASNIAVHERQTVDRETAVHLTSTSMQNGVEYHTDQFAMMHDKVEYVITFSRSATVSSADEETLAQSVMASWKWAS